GCAVLFQARASRPLAVGELTANELGVLSDWADDTAKALVPMLLHCDQPDGKVPGVVVSNVSRVPTGAAGAKRGSSSSSWRGRARERFIDLTSILPKDLFNP